MTRLLVLGLMLLTVSSTPAAFITIDNFGNPNPGTFYQITPAGGGPNFLTFSHSTGLGSTRTTTVAVDVPTPATPNSLTGVIGFEAGFNRGVFDFNSGTFAQARGILNYSNFTGTNGNFGAFGIPTYLYLNFLNLDPGINLSTNSPATNMPVDIAISTVGGTLSGSFLLSQTPVAVSYQIPIASLAGTGDLSQVLSMTVAFNQGPNQRQRSDFVVTGIVLEEIPAPAPPTALLALAGLPVIAWVRRRSLRLAAAA